MVKGSTIIAGAAGATSGVLLANAVNKKQDEKQAVYVPDPGAAPGAAPAAPTVNGGMIALYVVIGLIVAGCLGFVVYAWFKGE